MRKKFLCLAVIASVMLCSCGEHGESGDNQDTPMNSGSMQVISEQGSIQADIEPEPGSPQADSEPEEAMKPSLYQEEESVVSAASAFRAVLLNEMTFSCSGKLPHSYADADMPWEGLLRDQPFGPPEQKTICRFAVVDLDGDTVPEVVLEIEYYGYLILRYSEGQIYGSGAYYRAMENLRENGAFISSGGAFDNTVQKLFFVGDTYITDSKIQVLSGYDGTRYYIDDILISESGHDRVDALADEPLEVEWHDYTEEAVTEFIVENPLFAQLPAEPEESVRQHQAYLDSLSYLIELTYKSPEESPEEEYADAKSYYDGCSKEMEKIYQLCQEKLSGSALEALTDEQQIWERSNGRELRETLRNSNFDSMEKLEERMRLFYLTYGDIALRRTFKLINLYYGHDFYEWMDPTLSEYYGGPEELMGVVRFIEPEASPDQTVNQEVLSAMAKLTEADYKSAVSYEENSQKDTADTHVVLLNENAADDVKVYGYESEEYYSRGIIVQWDGQKSYFDYCWDRMYGNVKVYEGDYDHDKTDELCLCMTGQRGTGVYIERLILFEKNPVNSQATAHEFSGEIQQEGIKSKLLHEINADTGVYILQKEDGQGEVILDLTSEEAAGDKAIEIDCFDQVAYRIEDGRIWMDIDIGIRHHKTEPVLFLPDGKGIMRFEVVYSGEGFSLK